ncbi:uncharacterized protein BDV14DRAFT_26125 [Aspergillus stella-maris]|uniref:uncharacterized protein n=1 Tax=Aspergillus stella-maris TaxID=1810926 RepID=UPI003CCD94D8
MPPDSREAPDLTPEPRTCGAGIEDKDLFREESSVSAPPSRSPWIPQGERDDDVHQQVPDTYGIPDPTDAGADEVERESEPQTGLRKTALEIDTRLSSIAGGHNMNFNRDQGTIWNRHAVQTQKLAQRYPGIRHETATRPVQLSQPPTDPLSAPYNPQPSYAPLYATAPSSPQAHLNPQALSYAQALTNPPPISAQQQPLDSRPSLPSLTRLQQPGVINPRVIVQPATDEELFLANLLGQYVYRASPSPSPNPSPQIGSNSEEQPDIQSSEAADASALNQSFAEELLDQASEERRLNEALAAQWDVGAGAAQQGPQPPTTRPRRRYRETSSPLRPGPSKRES